jgi:hypothetical protein
MSLQFAASLKPYLTFVHPLLMWILLAISLYALYLGIQVRRTRLAEGDIKKELAKGRFNIRHYQIGSVLLALMVIGALGGMAILYINTGKLVPGPHLYSGLAMVALISTSASLVPFMQKRDWVRYIHITLNITLLGLFGWQALTGVQIVQRLASQM